MKCLIISFLRNKETSNSSTHACRLLLKEVIVVVLVASLNQNCVYSTLLDIRQPHSATSSSISYSPIPSPITSSSSDSPLCTSITPSLFHSRLKTYLFHKFYPCSFTSSSQTAFTSYIAWTVSSELLGFCFYFPLILSSLCRTLH